MSDISRLMVVDLDDWEIVVDLDAECVVSADQQTDWPDLAPFELVKTIYPYDQGLVPDDMMLSGHESYDELDKLGIIAAEEMS